VRVMLQANSSEGAHVKMRARNERAEAMAKDTREDAVRLHTNGLVDSYAVSWPGGGVSGLTYEASCEVAASRAAKTGLPFIDETEGEDE